MQLGVKITSWLDGNVLVVRDGVLGTGDVVGRDGKERLVREGMESRSWNVNVSERLIVTDDELKEGLQL